MTVKLYTDAGIRHGVATWAVVGVVDGVVAFESSGKLKADRPDNDSTAAELQAIANALHRAVRAGVVTKGGRVQLICDNQRAVAIMARKACGRVKERHRVVADAAFAIAAKHGIAIKSSGVKGHQRLESKCPHAPFNRRADQLCREARK